MDAIKSDTEALVQASNKMAEIIYSQQAQQQEPSGSDSDNVEEPPKTDKTTDDNDIVDADYEEVDDSKK